MAIFGSNNNEGPKPAKSSTNASTTIITAGALLKGEIELDCDFYFDGRMEGTIHSKGMITVGKNGMIKGDIKAAQLIVQGRVDGTVDVERLEIKEDGRVSGVVTSNEMVIEARGVFEGESHIKNTAAQPKPTQIPHKKEEKAK